MINSVFDVFRRLIAWVLRSVIRRTGGDVVNEDEQVLIQQYAEDITIGVSKESVSLAIKDGYEKLSRREKQGPYRIVEFSAHGTNPFTEFRVVMKGGA